MSKDELANEAIHVEQSLLREAVGAQDQISAAFGGFNHITFRQDGVYQVTPMILPRDRLEALQDHLLLFFTGHFAHRRRSGAAQIDNLRQHAAELRAMQQMVDRRHRRSCRRRRPTWPIRPPARRSVDGEAPSVGSRLEHRPSTPCYEAAIRAGADRRQAARRRRRWFHAALRPARRHAAARPGRAARSDSRCRSDSTPRAAESCCINRMVVDQ